MHENELSKVVIDAAFQIHIGLGPGLLERIYHRALYLDLKSAGLKVEAEVPIDAKWRGRNLGVGYKADLIIENKLIVELKSVEFVMQLHQKQLLTYLKLTNLKLGLLLNFNEILFKNGIYRIVNGLGE